jgi:hypothetical protein
MIYLPFVFEFTNFCEETPNGLRYWRVGCADSLDRQRKLEGRKMPEKPHRTHPSSARFVSPI